MTRFRWFVGLLGVLVIATIGLNLLTEHRNAAIGADHPADLLKRIETLETRVASLESQLLLQRTHSALPPPNVPKHWGMREFNGAPVYIVPLGDVESKNGRTAGDQSASSGSSRR